MTVATHTISDIIKNLPPNPRIVTAMAAAEPGLFFQHLSESHEGFEGAQIFCANPSRDYPCFQGEKPYDLVVMFLTSVVTHFQGHGPIAYAPQHLSQWARNLKSGGEIDVFWGVCTPPDKRGFVSMGPGACYETEIRRAAKKVVLEINPNLPVTFGDTQVPVEQVDFFLDGPRELPTIQRPKPQDEDIQIASYIESLIPEGATLQLGIGKIPNAVGRALEHRRGLGIHTEMINDTMMDLFLKGAVDGRNKTIWPGKIVGSFAYGSSDLYDFIDKNPLVELQPASVVNDPYRIGRNHRMVSINTAVEVDITGQVCSESIGHLELSGVGGAAETHLGAQRSEGGRGIIAIRSLTKKGDSKINLTLLPGAKVSISRNDTDTVVTEHGIAELRGRSVKERVEALINIAHPNHRYRLRKEAVEARYL